MDPKLVSAQLHLLLAILDDGELSPRERVAAGRAWAATVRGFVDQMWSDDDQADDGSGPDPEAEPDPCDLGAAIVAKLGGKPRHGTPGGWPGNRSAN